jgi:hypothetical protein
MVSSFGFWILGQNDEELKGNDLLEKQELLLPKKRTNFNADFRNF